VRKLLKLNEAECSTPPALALFKTAHDHWTDVQGGLFRGVWSNGYLPRYLVVRADSRYVVWQMTPEQVYDRVGADRKLVYCLDQRPFRHKRGLRNAGIWLMRPWRKLP